MATSECENERQVNETVLNSCNLKIENNLNEYFLLIIAVENDHSLLENLQYVTNLDCIKSFNDVETSLNFIRSQHDVNMFVIISGQLGRQYACKYIDIPQIVAVYVYCMNENEHKIWTKGILRIRCTVSDQEKLLKEVYRDIKELSARWPLGESSFQKAAISISDWYHLFLTVICYRSECIHESYKEIFNESRSYYRNNHHMLKEIDRVQQTYTSEKAIQEYTKNSFIYRIINHALRTKNIEIVRKFSPIIRDLNSQIHDIHRNYYKLKQTHIRAVYRGQYLSLDEFKYLRSIMKSNTTVITSTTFTSASLDPDVALSFISSVNGQIPCLFEIIIPDSYNQDQEYQLKHKQAFANIASISVHPDEQEVLFSLMTHFSVRYIGYEIRESERTWVPIQLELIKEEETKSIRGYFMVREWIEKEEDPNSYREAVDMLQRNAEDQLKFKNTNWTNWWNKLNQNVGKGIGSRQPLNLIFYDCFTEDPLWSRKAIELHKSFLRTYDPIQLNLSSFQSLYREFEIWFTRHTIAIAIYEDYLEQFCNEPSKEVVQCLCSIGDRYRNISDDEQASNCYQKALRLNVNDKYKKNKDIQNQMKDLQKSLRKKMKTDNPERQSVIQRFTPNIEEKYQKQQDLHILYEPIKSQDIIRFPPVKRLQQIFRYIQIRERWYDITDSRILLRLPHKTNDDLSVDDYRFHFLSAVLTHISFESSKTDATNNRSLSLWRYEKFISDWTLCKELERFFQPYQNKVSFIRKNILPRLQRLIKKLLVLITIVIIYKSIKQSTGNVNVNKILSINQTDPTMRHPIYTDLCASDLITALANIQEEDLDFNETSYIIPDSKRFPPHNGMTDFLDSIA